MKILVLGLGSMGKRRVRNLQALNVNVIGFDTSPNRRKESKDIYKIKVPDSLNDALDQNLDAMIISTPPDMHKEHALIAIKRGIPFFTEVNTMNPEDMQQIIDACKKNGVTGMPSCNVMFHPSMKRIKEILKKEMIGKIKYFHFHGGEYLPDWHPWEKVSEYYVGKKETGGGRDLIMWELNWIFQILGMPKTVFAHTKKLGEFDADIFDTYDLQIEFENGVLGTVMVDVFRRPPSRFCEIIGTKGTIRWNYDDGVVKCWNVDEGKWNAYLEKDDLKGYPKEEPKKGFATKDTGMVETYIDEMKEFIKIVEGKIPEFTFNEEKIILKTMFEAEASSEKGIKRAVHDHFD